MKKKVFLIAFLICTITTFSQNIIEYNGEQINALDENNNQTGIWKLFYDEEKVLITCEFKNGEFISNTNYYKDSKLIASYNNTDKLEIYKDSKTITCNFYRKDDKSQTLIDINGKELDNETLKYFYLNVGEVPAMFYGGVNKLYEFIGNNFNTTHKGKVEVLFKIDSKGFTTEIEIKSSTNEKLNDEAIRVIGILPRFQPAHQGGRFVKFSYLVPINIK
ncbi:MAG: energy transducer TonB [Bacteroidota bacterium]